MNDAEFMAQEYRDLMMYRCGPRAEWKDCGTDALRLSRPRRCKSHRMRGGMKATRRMLERHGFRFIA